MHNNNSCVLIVLIVQQYSSVYIQLKHSIIVYNSIVQYSIVFIYCTLVVVRRITGPLFSFPVRFVFSSAHGTKVCGHSTCISPYGSNQCAIWMCWVAIRVDGVLSCGETHTAIIRTSALCVVALNPIFLLRQLSSTSKFRALIVLMISSYYRERHVPWLQARATRRERTTAREQTPQGKQRKTKTEIKTETKRHNKKHTQKGSGREVNRDKKEIIERRDTTSSANLSNDNRAFSIRFRHVDFGWWHSYKATGNCRLVASVCGFKLEIANQESRQKATWKKNIIICIGAGRK